jgi:hypothetical protein
MIPHSIAQRARTVALILVSASFGSILTGAALAQGYQPYMASARASANQAINYLNQANTNKGGHRVNAINYLHSAIREINLGIRYANQNG